MVQLSVAKGATGADIVAKQLPASTFIPTSGGQVIVGAMLSNTVMSCVHVFVFPLPSVTVHVTTVTPFGYVVEG